MRQPVNRDRIKPSAASYDFSEASDGYFFKASDDFFEASNDFFFKASEQLLQGLKDLESNVCTKNIGPAISNGYFEVSKDNIKAGFQRFLQTVKSSVTCWHPEMFASKTSSVTRTQQLKDSNLEIMIIIMLIIIIMIIKFMIIFIDKGDISCDPSGRDSSDGSLGKNTEQ